MALLPALYLLDLWTFVNCCLLEYKSSSLSLEDVTNINYISPVKCGSKVLNVGIDFFSFLV